MFEFSNAIQRRRLINYASPDFDGFGFEVEAELEGDAQTTSLVAEGTNADGEEASANAGPAGTNFPAADGNPYSVEELSVQGAGDDNSQSSSSVNAAAYADLDPVRIHATYSAGDFTQDSDGAYGLAAVTSIDVIDLSAVYTNSQITANDQTITGLYASTSSGFGSLQLGVQEVDVDGASNRTEVIGRATYDIADNVYTSVEYGSFDKSNDEGDGFGVSLWYGF